MVATGWNKVRERYHEHDHTLVNVAVGGYNGHVLANYSRSAQRKPNDILDT